MRSIYIYFQGGYSIRYLPGLSPDSLDIFLVETGRVYGYNVGDGRFIDGATCNTGTE